jgi:hypothetical protein
MKTIIAGSRTLRAYPLLRWAIDSSRFEITEVFTGCASGIDQLAIRWAREHRVPYRLFPADWLQRGTPAGPIRNIQMANHADAVIAIWDGYSPGTRHMIRTAREYGLRLHVCRPDRAPLYHPRPPGGGLREFLAGEQPRALGAPPPTLFQRLRQAARFRRP